MQEMAHRRRAKRSVTSCGIALKQETLSLVWLEVAVRRTLSPLPATAAASLALVWVWVALAASLPVSARPAMPTPWLGFMPGLVFGLGTMLVLAVIGVLFGSFLRWARTLTEQQITRIGTETGARTLFYGGLLFIIFGGAIILGSTKLLPVDEDHFLIIFFMVGIAAPAFIYSYRRALAVRV